MISVMGATGHTGSAIASALLAAGEEVRALGRDEARLAGLAAAGAEARVGDVADAAFLAEAFRGADAVYTLIPVDPRAPDFHAAQAQVGKAIVTALARAGVKHVVALSSIGADLPAGTGVLAALHAQEERLRALTGVNVLLLRPGSFFENFDAMQALIEQQGIIADSVAPEVRFPMTATADIAAAAAEALRARDWSGVVVRELLGTRDLSYAEAARIIGAALGRPELAYVQLPHEEMERILVEAGYSADVARQQVGLSRALNEGIVRSVQGRNVTNTTRTPFEDFATGFAQRLRSADPVASRS